MFELTFEISKFSFFSENEVPSLEFLSSSGSEGSEPGLTLEIVTALSDPYTMVKTDAEAQARTGNDRYEGFAVDLITEIAKIVQFNFTLSPVSGYGSRRPDNSWTGMIGEILEGRADMAIGDMRCGHS